MSPTQAQRMMPLKLAYQVFGSHSRTSSPILILHGMFGSGNNWRSLGKKIASGLETAVYAIDARNHGNSDHVTQIDYNLMSSDTVQFCEEHKLDKVSLIGHSMGGKTAMVTALKYPQLVDKVVVVDVAPAQARGTEVTEDVVTALRSVDLSSVQSKKEADTMMEQSVPENRLKQYLSVKDFLLTNLVRDASTNRWTWRFNLNAIADSMHTLKDFPPITDLPFKGRTLFIGGAKSNYIRSDDSGAIKGLFPEAVITHIPDAGHWVHNDKPKDFLSAVTDFLTAVDHKM